MDSFLNFLVRQKKLALLFTLSIVVLGFMTLQKIQRDTYPVIEFDRLSINTSYPSASPRDVEKNITNVIESKIKGIYGIKELTSTFAPTTPSPTVCLPSLATSPTSRTRFT